MVVESEFFLSYYLDYGKLTYENKVIFTSHKNKLCPCRSDKEYQKCHGSSDYDIFDLRTLSAVQSFVQSQIPYIKAVEEKRQDIQGKGKPIISRVVNGIRTVYVGKQPPLRGRWKTFHDFLMYFIKKIMGEKWGNEEIRKLPENRHPLIQWYQKVCEHKKKHVQKPGEIYSMPITGACEAYSQFAYSLYLLQHNNVLPKKRIKQLRNADSFWGTYYEIQIAANFIKAGFDIEWEDERKGHGEFVAMHQTTKKKFSVEAKFRKQNKNHAGVSQLTEALRQLKGSDHFHIVFIDINLPEEFIDFESNKWAREVIEYVRSLEKDENWREEKPAYIFFTNHPCLYNLDSTSFGKIGFPESFKIPELKSDFQPTTRERAKIEENHKEIFDFIDSMKSYNAIPQFFEVQLSEKDFIRQQIHKEQHEIKDGYDLYEFFYENYKKTSKENLLELMKPAFDYEKLKSLSQEELAKEYCLRLAEAEYT